MDHWDPRKGELYFLCRNGTYYFLKFHGNALCCHIQQPICLSCNSYDQKYLLQNMFLAC